MAEGRTKETLPGEHGAEVKRDVQDAHASAKSGIRNADKEARRGEQDAAADARRRTYIAIDGGGTKTVCLLGDGEGRILALCRGESGNVKSRPWPEVLDTLRSLIREALALSGTTAGSLGGIYLGLAGSDRPEDRRRIAEGLRTPELADVPLTVNNDAVTALAAGTWGRRGIALISGTGSIAYGFDPATGALVRVGGWGYLLGDEGSGFDLGRRALTAVMRAYDGRGEPTRLTALALAHWGLTEPGQLINAVYEQPNVRSAIADSSRLVVQAAAEGDPVAERLLTDAALALAELARTAAAEMAKQAATPADDAPEPMPLVLSGGLFSDAAFERRFRRLPAVASGLFEAMRLERPPVVGAYVLALQERGIEWTETMKRRIADYVFH